MLAAPILVLICVVAAAAQQSAPAQTKTPKPAVKAAQTQRPKLKLLDLPPVNPTALAETLRPAAANSPAEGKAALPASDKSIMEFRAVSGSGSGEFETRNKSSKHGFLKNVHGELYGAAAPGLANGDAASAAVGASSKGGKAHIFIETDHNRDLPSR